MVDFTVCLQKGKALGYLTKEEVAGTAHLSSRKAAAVLGVGKSTVNNYRKLYATPEIDLPNAKILTLDIESKPHKVYTWDLWQPTIGMNQIIEDGGMICFAAKWLGKPEVEFYSDFEHGHRVMVQKAHEMLSEADLVVTYNGDRYDIKRLNNEFLRQKMGPPKPYQSIDIYKQNKKNFDFPSKKLDYLAQLTGSGGKVKHQGFDLWVSCMEGDPEAWALMEEYNKGDVIITEKTYISLLPWLSNVPHIGMFTGDGDACPYCGSVDLTYSGTTSLKIQSYDLWHCENCEGYSRGNKPLGTVLKTRIA